MKKLILGFAFIFLSLLFFKVTLGEAQANARCITFKIKVTASHWPGGGLQVGCPGDRGPQCVGQIKDIRPGQKEVVLGKCSCFPNQNGCLTLGKKLKFGPMQNGKKKIVVVTKIPAKCTLTNTKKFCGSNGQHKKANFKLVCTKAPTTPTNTPTPTPGICVGPKKVTNVKVTCPNCFSSSEPTPTPEPPTPTPSQTASCGTSSKPLLTVVGSSSKDTVGGSAVFTFKITNCSKETRGLRISDDKKTPNLWLPPKLTYYSEDADPGKSIIREIEINPGPNLQLNSTGSFGFYAGAMNYLTGEDLISDTVNLNVTYSN